MQILNAKQSLSNHCLILGIGEFRESSANGKGKQQKREHITFKKRLHYVILGMKLIAFDVRCLRSFYRLHAIAESLCQQVAWYNEHVEHNSHGSSV